LHGIDPAEADRLAAVVMADPDEAVDFLYPDEVILKLAARVQQLQQQGEIPAETEKPTVYKAITGEVLAEIARATAKFPPFHSTHEGYAILREEVDELWDAIRANDTRHALDEVVQVAAMACRFIHDIRAKGYGHCPHDELAGAACTTAGDESR
jgi:hypothetical protein